MSIIRQKKLRNKKAKIVIFIVILIIALICVVSVVHRYIQKKTMMENLSQSEKQGVSESVKEDEGGKYQTLNRNIPDDLRIHYYNNIIISDKLSVGDYVDIRICFENGMDFIVLSKKLVIDLSKSNSEGNENKAIWLEVSEEEILRMSSAFVDNKLGGSNLYAIQYIDDSQKASISNYPVTDEMKDLIKNNPNVSNPGNNILEYHSRRGIELLNGVTDSFDTNEDIEYLD